jgi:hypothetical protein
LGRNSSEGDFTIEELFGTARVAERVLFLEGLEPVERLFLRVFAGDVVTHCKELLDAKKKSASPAETQS